MSRSMTITNSPKATKKSSIASSSPTSPTRKFFTLKRSKKTRSAEDLDLDFCCAGEDDGLETPPPQYQNGADSSLVLPIYSSPITSRSNSLSSITEETVHSRREEEELAIRIINEYLEETHISRSRSSSASSPSQNLQPQLQDEEVDEDPFARPIMTILPRRGSEGDLLNFSQARKDRASSLGNIKQKRDDQAERHSVPALPRAC